MRTAAVTLVCLCVLSPLALSIPSKPAPFQPELAPKEAASVSLAPSQLSAMPEKGALSKLEYTGPLTQADMEGNFINDNSWNNTKHGMNEPTPIDEFNSQQAQSQPQPAPAANQNEPHLPDIVFAIPTMRRWTKEHQPAPEAYLKPLITTLRDQMTPQQQKHVTFLLMNVDKQPNEHKELLELQSLPGVRVITKDPSGQVRANSDRVKLDDGRELSKQAFEWVAGETHDVPTLLLQASSMAPYVVFLEDDVKPTTSAVSKIYQFLEEMKNEGKSEFFMADLYTPAIAWGPQSAMNKEKYSYECCTQAMLFNSRRIHEICDYEMTHPGKPVDDNIRDFVKEDPNGRAVYAMVPNPFEHVGRFSSNPEKSTGTLEHRSLNFVP